MQTLTLASFKMLFNMISLKDQQNFVNDLPKIIKLQKDFDIASKEGEITILICKCGNYVIYHGNAGIPFNDKGMWSFPSNDLKLQSNDDYEYDINLKKYIYELPWDNYENISFKWNNNCVRGTCPDCQ